MQLGIGACRVGCTLFTALIIFINLSQKSIVCPTERIDSKRSLNACLLSIILVVDLLKNDFWFGSDGCGKNCGRGVVHCDLECATYGLLPNDDDP